MEWITIVSAALSVLGTGGLGGFFLASRKSSRESKLNEAQIKQITEQARQKMYDDMQEDRKFYRENFNDMSRQLFALSARVVKLESILILHNIPLPE